MVGRLELRWCLLAWQPVKSLACCRSRGGEEEGRDTGPRRPRTFEEEANAERAAAMLEASTFEGCYPALLASLLQLLPEKVSLRPDALDDSSTALSEPAPSSCMPQF